MRHSRRLCSGLLAAMLLPGLVPAAESGDEFRPRRFRVDSVPGGAEVFVLGGRVGTTPLTLSERDIYPNWYPDAQAHLYGMIVLRRSGCREYSRRVGRDDIARGIEARLECGQEPGTANAAPAAAPAPVAVGDAGSGAAAPVPAAVLQRRLRQLQVLQELLEDGLVTEKEERTIRKRILDAP